MFIISWDFLMAEQMFLPPQPKQTVMWLLVINWYMRVASWVAERLKIQNLRGLGNIRKISKLQRFIDQCLVLLPRWRFCQCYNHGHNILRIFVFYQVFLSPQVKRSLIISNKLYIRVASRAVEWLNKV